MSYVITQKLLTPNKYSRPQTPLKQVTKIALHYVGDKGASALAIRNYFESLKIGKSYVSNGNTVYRYASSHYVIGLKGEVIQCLPENEWSYCTNSANSYSLSIEVCHPEWDGKYTEKTYNTMVELCADLCMKYKLNPIADLIRHFDVTKKICPRWFVDNPNEWIIFKDKVKKRIDEFKELINVIEKTWEQLTGEKALDLLAQKGLVNNADAWKAKDLRNENVPLWLFFEMINRVSK